MRTEPWIGLLQENLMKFLSTVYLPYIYLAHSLYYTILVYSKETYVHYKVNIYKICHMTLSF